MGVMSPASGRETEKMVARGSSSNTRVASDSRNDADAARTSGRRAGADGEDEDEADASPSAAGSGCIRSYRWPWRSAGRRSMFMEAARRGNNRSDGARPIWLDGEFPRAVIPIWLVSFGVREWAGRKAGAEREKDVKFPGWTAELDEENYKIQERGRENGGILKSKGTTEEHGGIRAWGTGESRSVVCGTGLGRCTRRSSTDAGRSSTFPNFFFIS